MHARGKVEETAPELRRNVLMNSSAAVTYDPTEVELSLRTLNEAGRRQYLALFFAEFVMGPRLFNRVLGPARERHRARMLEYFADWPKNERRPVREIEFTTHDAFRKAHVPEWEPVVFRGVAKQWPAVRKWNLDYFAETFPDTKAVLGDQHGLFGEKETGEYEISTLGKVVAGINAGRNMCLRFSPIIDENPHLKDDLDMKWLEGFRGPLSVRGLPQFFLAPGGIYTPMHCALECNAFVQISGKKRWILYPAMYQPMVEPVPDRRVYYHTDFHPDRESPRFPLGPYAPAYEVVLDEGDVMYIPPFAWHHVENLTNTIAIGYRYNSLRTAMRTAWPLTVGRFMATRPTIFRTLYQSLIGTNFLYKPRVQ